MTLSAFPPSGGTLSPYLVGVWHRYNGGTFDPAPNKLETWLELLNPTSHALDYRAVFFGDARETTCRKGTVSANGYELRVIKDVPSSSSRAGVIKIVSFHEGTKRLQPGLVGYARLTSFHTRFLMGIIPAGEEETGRAYLPLFSVPKEVLEDGELAIIMAACP